MRLCVSIAVLTLLCLVAAAGAGDWAQFRGPGGLGVAEEGATPVAWSSSENIAWQADLPGPGSSSPIVFGNRVVVTCYTGYGLEPNQGDQKELKRHVLCFDRRDGRELWRKEFAPKLPEHDYQGEGSYHGYAASTPATDGERLYLFFGKSGVYCLDVEGNEVWHAEAGEGIHGWGSGASPVLHEGLVIINASVESGSLAAFDKLTGKEAWRSGGVGGAWNTPLIVKRGATAEAIVSTESRLKSFNVANGQPLWDADGVHRYVCPSVVSHGDLVFAIGGGHTSLAVRLGGKGDVTATHAAWRETKGSNVGSPIYRDGHLYWVSDSGGYVCCQDAKTGATVFQERLDPPPGTIWSSPILADGKLYIVSQSNGTYVTAAEPKFKQLAHNVLEDDGSRTNASPAAANGRVFLRSDRRLYCIGARESK